jgi:hypothetical protein
MCLNYHDYNHANLNEEAPKDVIGMHDFRPTDYEEKKIQFSYEHRVYHFNVKVNPQVDAIFTNYPGVDVESYLNIPLNRQKYSSLIPMLKRT